MFVRLLTFFVFLIGLAVAADVVVIAPKGCALKASSDHQAKDVVGTVTNGQRLTLSGHVYGDAVKIKVVKGSKGATTNVAAWLWVRAFTEATKGKAVQVGKQFVIGGEDAPQGCALFRDTSWASASKVGVLWPGDIVETTEVAVTWRGVQGDKWVYAPYVKDVQ